MLNEKAYAKINLYLDVCGVRDDGFHNIKSIMHSVGLFDELKFSFEDSEKIIIEISCNMDFVPCDRSNIIYRSIEAYLKKYGLKAKVCVHLTKNIPVCAGLGGGSADGAAALRAMNRQYEKASLDELIEIAAEIGSDIPFCLIGGAALCEGRGEVMTEIAPTSGVHTVIAIGKERVSTPKAYSDIDKKYPDLNERPERECEILEKLTFSIANGEAAGNLYNIFEEVVELPEIAEIKKMMIEHDAISAMMSGSGPSVFGFFKSEKQARCVADALIASGYEAYYTTTIDKA